jgi:hypothetical protein
LPQTAAAKNSFGRLALNQIIDLLCRLFALGVPRRKSIEVPNELIRRSERDSLGSCIIQQALPLHRGRYIVIISHPQRVTFCDPQVSWLEIQGLFVRH